MTEPSERDHTGPTDPQPPCAGCSNARPAGGSIEAVDEHPTRHNGLIANWATITSSARSKLSGVIALAVFATGTLGFLSDFMSVKSSFLPCLGKKEELITASYAIAMGNSTSTRAAEPVISNHMSEVDRISEIFYAKLEAMAQRKETSVGVGRACAKGMRPSSENRSVYLNHVGEDLGADIVIGLLFEESHGHTYIRPEIQITGAKWNEAAELSGYYPLSARYIGSLGAAPEIAISATEAAVQPDLELLAGITAYSTGRYAQSLNYFQAFLNSSGTLPQAQRLTYVLSGNAWGRLSELGKAEQSYRQALRVDPNYPRAYIGLAELEFQVAASSCVINAPLSSEAQARLRASDQLLSDIKTEQYGAEIPYLDARILYAKGRTEVCRALTGDQVATERAKRDLLSVIHVYESSPTLWPLRHLASEAHGKLGWLFWILSDRSEACHHLISARDLAVDEAQIGRRSHALTESQACAPAQAQASPPLGEQK